MPQFIPFYLDLDFDIHFILEMNTMPGSNAGNNPNYNPMSLANLDNPAPSSTQIPFMNLRISETVEGLRLVDTETPDGKNIARLFPNKELLARKGMVQAGVLVDAQKISLTPTSWYKMIPSNVTGFNIMSKGQPIQFDSDGNWLVSTRVS